MFKSSGHPSRFIVIMTMRVLGALISCNGPEGPCLSKLCFKCTCLQYCLWIAWTAWICFGPDLLPCFCPTLTRHSIGFIAVASWICSPGLGAVGLCLKWSLSTYFVATLSLPSMTLDAAAWQHHSEGHHTVAVTQGRKTNLGRKLHVCLPNVLTKQQQSECFWFDPQTSAHLNSKSWICGDGYCAVLEKQGILVSAIRNCALNFTVSHQELE